jgi:hypothetical protein
MPRLEEPVQLFGYAWINDDGDFIWCFREDLDGKEKPVEATPVSIEFIPVSEWIEKQEYDEQELNSVMSQLNKFRDEYKNFLLKERIKK